MRKVLSLVLALSLVLGSFTMVFGASQFGDVEGTKYEDAVNVLYDLGVITGDPGGVTYRPEDTINRAEIAILIVKAMGMENQVTTNATSSFTDMSGYGFAEGYISFAQGMGIVSGYPGGTFQPGNVVTYDEASTMLVATLGYTNHSLNGSWPANFVSQAKALGITKDIVATSSGATRGDVAIMIYQTLNCKIGTTNSDGNWVANQGGDTMLGRLEAEEAYGGDWFVLRDSDADVSVMNTRSLVGAYVKAFWNSDEEIITVSEVKSQFLTGKLNDDLKFKADGIEYTVSSDVRGTTADYFENGIYQDSGYLYREAGKDANGATIYDGAGWNSDDKKGAKVTIAAEVTGKTVRDIYSITKWTIDEHFQAEEGDLSDLKDVELRGFDFPEDYYGEIDYNKFDLRGIASLDDLKEDHVVYLYTDNDEITRMEVGTETVTGTISRIRDKSDITISGTTYEFTEAFKFADYDGDDFEAGDTVTLYLDYVGDWYDLKVSDGSVGNYAIVLGLKDGGFDEPQARLFLADGTSKTFDVVYDASNVEKLINSDKTWRITGARNGNSWDYDVLASEKVDDQISVGDLVKYGVNNSGEITRLEKQIAKVADPIKSNYVEDKEITSRGILQQAGTLSNNVVIFTVDGVSTTGTGTNNELVSGDRANNLNAQLQGITASKLSVTTYDKVLGLKNVTAKYVLDSNKIAAMVMDGKATSDDDIYGVITNADLVDNSAGGEITILVKGKEVVYEADDEEVKKVLANDDKTQKLVKLEFDSAGAVNNVIVVSPTTKHDEGLVMMDYDISGYDVDFTTGSRSIKLTNGQNNRGNITTDGTTYIYELNAAGDKWTTVSNLNNLDGRAKYQAVWVFDAIDEDGLADTIVVQK